MRLRPGAVGSIVSHPFDLAQGRLFRKVPERMGRPQCGGVGEAADRSVFSALVRDCAGVEFERGRGGYKAAGAPAPFLDDGRVHCRLRFALVVERVMSKYDVNGGADGGSASRDGRRRPSLREPFPSAECPCRDVRDHAFLVSAVCTRTAFRRGLGSDRRSRSRLSHSPRRARTIRFARYWSAVG